MAFNGDLNQWDEKYHALISKNIFNSILAPQLYKDYIFEFDYKNWTKNEIWLSKPFLPFLLIGSFLKLLGNNLLALRIGSIIFGTSSLILIFKISKILFDNKTAILSAFLYAINGLILEITGGKISSDHVDIMHLFFSLFAILKIIEYHKSKSKTKLIWSSIFFSCALLCKWIMPIVLIPLFLYIIFKPSTKLSQKITNTLIFGSVSLAIFLPYLYYIFTNYNSETIYIISQLLNLIEIHNSHHYGPPWFYLNKIGTVLGELVYIPILWMFGKLYIEKLPFNYTVLFIWFFIPIILLSISETKRITYILTFATPIFILTANFILHIRNYSCFKEPKLISNIILVLLIALPIRYSIERIKPFQKRLYSNNWKVEIEEIIINNKKQNIILHNEPKYIEAMFYFDLNAYQEKLNHNQIKFAKQKGFIIFEKKDSGYNKN